MARGRDGMLGQGGQRRKMSKKDMKGAQVDHGNRGDAADSRAAMLERIKAKAAKRTGGTGTAEQAAAPAEGTGE